MNTYIALFRGINVGGNNILPMRDLVEALESLDLENIRTYIQSGNVVFCSKKKDVKKLSATIGLSIEKNKGFSPKILILSLNDYKQAINSCPFTVKDGKLLHYFFLASIPKSPNLEGLLAIKVSSEEYELINNVLYLHAPNGIGRSKLAAKAEKLMGVPATARNWNTVQKLLLLAKG